MNKHPSVRPTKRHTVKQILSKRYPLVLLVLFILAVFLFFLSPKILTMAGESLVMDLPLSHADAIIVLNTGTEYYPRLIEAARIYQKGFADHIAVNGNRKTDVIRKLEAAGYTPACHWYENHQRILSLFDIPKEKIICISAEDVYDTVSEARFVGEKLLLDGYTKFIITTSKSHTKRAYHIWNDLFQSKAEISVVSAKDDPFQPDAWWKSGRQVRWVLAEYGAWIYYFWKNATHPVD